MPGICFEMLPYRKVREFFVQSACLAAGIVRGGLTAGCCRCRRASNGGCRLPGPAYCVKKERIRQDALFWALPENPGQAFFEWALIAPMRNTR